MVRKSQRSFRSPGVSRHRADDVTGKQRCRHPFVLELARSDSSWLPNLKKSAYDRFTDVNDYDYDASDRSDEDDDDDGCDINDGDDCDDGQGINPPSKFEGTPQ